MVFPCAMAASCWGVGFGGRGGYCAPAEKAPPKITAAKAETLLSTVPPANGPSPRQAGALATPTTRAAPPPARISNSQPSLLPRFEGSGGKTKIRCSRGRAHHREIFAEARAVAFRPEHDWSGKASQNARSLSEDSRYRPALVIVAPVILTVSLAWLVPG